MLVTGSVIIGRREEGKETGNSGTAGAEGSPTGTAGPYADEPDAPLANIDSRGIELGQSERRRSRSQDREARD